MFYFGIPLLAFRRKKRTSSWFIRVQYINDYKAVLWSTNIMIMYIFNNNTSWCLWGKRAYLPTLTPKLKYLLFSKRHNTLKKKLSKCISSISWLCQGLMSPLRWQQPHRALNKSHFYAPTSRVHSSNQRFNKDIFFLFSFF